MIYYLVTSQHHYAMSQYLRSWGKALAQTVQVVPYAALPGNLDMPGGTYVFSDLERLGPAQRALAADVWSRLAGAGSAVKLLNHPVESLRRYELLTRLHEVKRNRFNAYRCDAPGQPWRYPVFVRHEKEHTGNLSPLLKTEAELRIVLLKMVMDGHALSDLLVVEYCDTADAEGVFRKYSAFRIGDRIFPRHVLFSRNWVLKDVDLLEPAHIAELKDYCRDNPHEAEVRAIFELAKIEYGRIDYSILEGGIQTWEINTNPLVMRPPEQYRPATHAFHEAFAKTFGEALAAVNLQPSPVPRIPMGWRTIPIWEM